MSQKKRKNRSKKTEKQRNIKTTVQKPKEPATVVDVRSDLRKTAILTAACLLILFILFLTQSRFLP